VVEAQQKGKAADLCSIVSAPRQFDGFGNANYQACAKGCRPVWPMELEKLYQNFDQSFAVAPDATFFANATTTYDNYFGTKLGLKRVEFPACPVFHFWKR
jgi:hypothetical protein